MRMDFTNIGVRINFQAVVQIFNIAFVVGRCRRQGSPGTTSFFSSVADNYLDTDTRGLIFIVPLGSCVAELRLVGAGRL